YIHLIFSTKNREPNIVPRYREEMFKYIAGALDDMGCSAIFVGGMDDHIHALFCLSRTKTISDVVRDVKANSTKWMKEKLGCNFMWQNGYAVFSVSQSMVEKVRHYIENQSEHHKKKSFQDEYRDFLKSYGISYDENYVWN
ncbi:MAG: IS200/IS605 family transposase, partial [Prevotella sp.]|nr:IS200/IS605 family transposase [Prevotella sp.]